MASRLALLRSRAWLIIAAACVVPAVLDVFKELMQARLVGQTADWREVIWSGGEWLFLGVLTPITSLLASRWPLSRPHLSRNLAVHFMGALVMCVGWAGMGAAARFALGTAPTRIPATIYVANWVLTSLPWSVFMYFAVLGCVYAFSYMVEVRERDALAARLSAQLAEARLGALRMQLNPHFLFNSLNAVTVLVRDQQTRPATRMLELLSDVLRQVLRTDRAHEVTLAEELHFLRQYLAIEEVRFSDRLRVTIDVDDGLLDAAVPPFILQPLVENALRHGLARRTDAGSIVIHAEQRDGTLVLSVRDDGPGPQPAAEGTAPGVGLANTRERLQTLYGAEASVVLAAADPGALATITLPYRQLEGPARADA